MTRSAPIPATVTLRVPFRVVKRGGRKEVHVPEDAEPPQRTDITLIKALARAFRWKRMLDSGDSLPSQNWQNESKLPPLT